MTDKEAIERCNELIKEEHANWIGISNQVAIETVLNLIETQQKEIERLKCNNEILQGELDRIGVETLKLEAGSSTDDVIAEIEKKDKIIDLMTQQIKFYDERLLINNYQSEYEIKKTFINKVEKEK